jgi:hypothetical protein
MIRRTARHQNPEHVKESDRRLPHRQSERGVATVGTWLRSSNRPIRRPARVSRVLTPFSGRRYFAHLWRAVIPLGLGHAGCRVALHSSTQPRHERTPVRVTQTLMEETGGGRLPVTVAATLAGSPTLAGPAGRQSGGPWADESPERRIMERVPCMSKQLSSEHAGHISRAKTSSMLSLRWLGSEARQPTPRPSIWRASPRCAVRASPYPR